MSENQSENSNMSSIEFTQYALRSHLAPPEVGSVKARIRLAARRLGWTHNRTKDAWYADPRISMSADEIRDIEEKTGLRYARQELRSVDELIAAAERLLDGPDPDFHRPYLAALRAIVGAFHSARTR